MADKILMYIIQVDGLITFDPFLMLLKSSLIIFKKVVKNGFHEIEK